MLYTPNNNNNIRQHNLTNKLYINGIKYKSQERMEKMQNMFKNRINFNRPNI